MSVQQLGPPPVVTGWVSVARESVTTAAGIDAAAIEGGELAAALAETAVLESQVAALKLSLLAEADRRGVGLDPVWWTRGYAA